MDTVEQSQIPMKPCTVCGKAIEEPKYRIHEATCARNNFKCPKCQEIVPKSEKDHHEQEYHLQVRSHFSLDMGLTLTFIG
jgi:predicted nucleic acid-binding Zn ribbon protein